MTVATYAIKTRVERPQARRCAFAAQKTMYGGKRIAVGDAIFVFASENEGGSGLVAKGVVRAAEPTPRKVGVELGGVLAEELQLHQVFAAAVVAGTGQLDAARRLIAFLASDGAASAIRSGGMEPVRARRP